VSNPVTSRWCRFHLQGGDHGQRYEVRYRDGKGTERVFGWAGKPEGARLMVDAIRKHPVWYWPRIVDRHQSKETVG